MTRTALIITLAAAAALAGCKKENHTIIAGGPPDDMNATNSAGNAPVALPPSISASKVYRCADNKVVYVDWLSDNKTANVRTDQRGNATLLTSAGPDQPFTAAGGYELSGSPTASTAKIAVPGHPSQICKA